MSWGFRRCLSRRDADNIFRGSSMVEQPAVNRLVVGSNPTRGVLNDESSPFWVYILENEHGRFYIGSTSDLSARIAHHNMIPDDHPGWTQKHGPWRLVWQEGHPDCGSAVRREREIKAKKSVKWIRQALLHEAT